MVLTVGRFRSRRGMCRRLPLVADRGCAVTYALGSGSLAQLAGVHPRLVEVVKRAIALTTQDCSVHDGLRTHAEQAELVARGASRTLLSKHLPQADGLGHAVDLVPYIGRTLRWEWAPIYVVADAMRRAAIDLDVAITWGACWDADIRGTQGSMQSVRDGYVSRRGPRAFLDGPHYELRA